MATIMWAAGALGGPNGGVRRCDARCHNAAGKACDCICGGRYHGKANQAQTLLTADFQAGRWIQFGKVNGKRGIGWHDPKSPVPYGRNGTGRRRHHPGQRQRQLTPL